MRLFLTGSTRHLFRAITKSRHDIGRYDSYTFADGERGYRLTEQVRGWKVGVIGSVLPQPDSLFELLSLFHLVWPVLILWALRRVGYDRRALLGCVIGMLRDLGTPPSELSVNAAPSAVETYERLGFVAVTTSTPWVWTPPAGRRAPDA